MNNKFKRILRIAAPVVLCFAFVFNLAAPVSALEFLDYQDFATYDFSDDFANVTVNLPTQQCRWDAYGINYSSYIGTFRGSSFVWSVPTGNYAMFVNPFGTSFNVNSNVNDSSSDGFAIKLDDLPKDAVITSVIKISFPDANGLIHEQSSFRNYYVTGDSIVVRSDSTGVPVVSGNSFSFTNTFYREDYSGSGDGFLFALSIPDFWVSTDGAVICELERLSISFSISGLQYQAQQSGKTNQLLEDVKDALADQGQILDDAVHGSVPDSQLPTNSGILDDYENKENELWGSVSGGLDDANNSFANSSSYVANLTATFAFVAAMCNDLWLIEPFGSLLHVCLSLGVTASILGLGYLAARSSSRSGSSGRRKKGGG